MTNIHINKKLPSSPFIQRVIDFATAAHAGQKRKYSREPYINHPLEVASIVAGCPEIEKNYGHATHYFEEMIAVALLHDTLEDTDTTYTDLYREFGKSIADTVLELTNVSTPSDGDRATRKEIERNHLLLASPIAKTIKLADLISNLEDIAEEDPDFAKIYVREKFLLLPILLGSVSDNLYVSAVRICNYTFGKLGMSFSSPEWENSNIIAVCVHGKALKTDA